MLFMVACTTTKNVQQPAESAQQKIQAEDPIAWKQVYYPKLTLGDPINFLNSKEVMLDGSTSESSFFIQDGTIYRIDSVLNIKKTVPRLTLGVLSSLRKGNNGQITEMIVSFSNDDASYQLTFLLKQDGTFTLNGKAKLLYNNKEFPITVATVNGECLLLVNFKTSQEVLNVNEQAQGAPVQGTKIIK